MYARVTTFYLKVKFMEEASKVYQESIIPEAQKQQGFLKAFFLTNKNAGKFVAITIWESIEHALANQKSGYYQNQIDKFEEFMVVTPPEVEGFSVGAIS
jgi:quinol monooxygenase YgiN